MSIFNACDVLHVDHKSGRLAFSKNLMYCPLSVFTSLVLDVIAKNKQNLGNEILVSPDFSFVAVLGSSCKCILPLSY